jgi:hypothetical protein
MSAADFNCSPMQNPCAQCGKPIERPIWSERGRDRMSFVWSCDACDYQFTTIAIFGEHTDDHHRIAA